jgi:hypothetical protein
VRAAGTDLEAEVDFVTLHQLLLPILGELDALTDGARRF